MTAPVSGAGDVEELAEWLRGAFPTSYGLANIDKWSEGVARDLLASDWLAARVQAARAEERKRLVNPDDETLTRMADAAWAASETATRWVTHDMMLAALAALRTPDAAPEEES